MAAKRRQQKLLGHGLRWQGADTTCVVVRQLEVERAQAALLSSYQHQKSMSDGTIQHLAQLQRKRPLPSATTSSKPESFQEERVEIEGKGTLEEGCSDPQESELADHQSVATSSSKRFCRQAERGRDCLARFQAASGRYILERRRGVAVEAFGQREDGRWVLDPEEVLYLAERGSLSVTWDAELAPAVDSASSKIHQEASANPCISESTRDAPPALDSTLLELHRRLLRGFGHRLGQSSPSFDGYSVYSNLRRSGLTVRRSATSENSSSEVGPVGSPTRHQSTWLTLPADPTSKGEIEPACPGPTDVQPCNEVEIAGKVWKVGRTGHVSDMPLYVASPYASILTVYEHLQSCSKEPTPALLAMASPSAGNPNYLELVAPEKPQRNTGQVAATSAPSEPVKQALCREARARALDSAPSPVPAPGPTPATATGAELNESNDASDDLDAGSNLQALMETGAASFYQSLRERALEKG